MKEADINSPRRQLAELIDSNWFIEAPPETPRFPPSWNFESGIQALDPSALRLLLQIHLAGRGLNDLGIQTTPEELAEIMAGKRTSIGGGHVGLEDLITTLKMIAVSEYRLDSLLLWPAKLRDQEVEAIASNLGVEPELLNSFYIRWHDRIRSRIYDN